MTDQPGFPDRSRKPHRAKRSLGQNFLVDPNLQRRIVEALGHTVGGSTETVLVYGHLDKQPEMTGWREGLGPWTPVIEAGRLYGRGGADDGYAVFCALAALRALQHEKRPHARVAMLIECCEESGSYDLPAYLEALAPRIGTPALVLGLDSGCGNYEQLWGTSSLRGLVNGVLTVEVLTEGVHSGDASGVVASSFRIARTLLDRLDDPGTGTIKDKALHAPIPPQRVEQAKLAASVLGEQTWRKFPFVPGMRAMHDDPAELMADVGRGLYVTELIGQGVNPVTGDYSRGASGFIVEDGEIAAPVAEITIAGNLIDMFRRLAAANDLDFRRAVNAPTLRIDGMTVAGA